MTHAWNHSNEHTKLVSFLLDTGILQTKHQHAKHHKAPYDRYYCTLGNVVNAVLEKINFWRNLEWVILKVFRIPIKRGLPEREGY